MLHHHERWDGAGYPDGLAGQEIPLSARIFSVCDALEAMTARRPYREPVSASAAMAEIHGESGRQFDPSVVDALEQGVTRGDIDLARHARPWPPRDRRWRRGPLLQCPVVSLRQKYRLRTPSTGRELIVEAEPGEDYIDRETGEQMEVVGELLPLAPSPSELPWAVENLRFCNWCDQLTQKDLNDCPHCGRRMSPLPR